MPPPGPQNTRSHRKRQPGVADRHAARIRCAQGVHISSKQLRRALLEGFKKLPAGSGVDGPIDLRNLIKYLATIDPHVGQACDTPGKGIGGNAGTYLAWARIQCNGFDQFVAHLR